jgi:hypothetical protein
MSQDPRAKKVGSWWLFADKATQGSADLEALCEPAEISPAEFIGVITGVAFELRRCVVANRRHFRYTARR